MTTKNIEDVVAELEWLASPEAETLSDGKRITEFCKAVHKLDLTQLVKEVGAWERERITNYLHFVTDAAESMNGKNAIKDVIQHLSDTPPTSDEALQDN